MQLFSVFYSSVTTKLITVLLSQKSDFSDSYICRPTNDINNIILLFYSTPKTIVALPDLCAPDCYCAYNSAKTKCYASHQLK